jgi:hypothetical protein
VVDLTWRQGSLTGADLRTARDGTVDIRLPDGSGRPVVTGPAGGEVVPDGVSDDGRQLRFALRTGVHYRLSFPAGRSGR